MGRQEREREQGLTEQQWLKVESVIQQTHRKLTTEQTAALAHTEDDLYDEDGIPA